MPHRGPALPSRLLPVVVIGLFGVVVASSGPALAATTVDLGTAGAFAVLAGSGITNKGETTITGDIGTSPTSAETGVGACPAANCVVLTGSNHPDDATARQAKKDLTTAYNAAAGQTPDPDPLPADLGGQTYTTGVYNTPGALGLTGQVTLDAEGVEGAVFIFQIGDKLVTASASEVLLVNGASACNVFWQVGSAATLGEFSTFRGTILAHDTITLGDDVTVEGRLLGGEQASGEGAVTMIHDTITTGGCTSGGSTTGTTGTSGGSTSGTTGTTGGSTSGTSGTTGGTTGTTSGTTTGSSGGTTGAGTGGTTSTGTAGSGAGGSSSTPGPTLPNSGAATGTAALVGVLSLLLGALALLASRFRTRSPRH